MNWLVDLNPNLLANDVHGRVASAQIHHNDLRSQLGERSHEERRETGFPWFRQCAFWLTPSSQAEVWCFPRMTPENVAAACRAAALESGKEPVLLYIYIYLCIHTHIYIYILYISLSFFFFWGGDGVFFGFVCGFSLHFDASIVPQRVSSFLKYVGGLPRAKPRRRREPSTCYFCISCAGARHARHATVPPGCAKIQRLGPPKFSQEPWAHGKPVEYLTPV